MSESKIYYIVGQRQLLRELKSCNVATILLAADADAGYKKSIIQCAEAYGVEVTENGTMRQIADKYGIEVPSAVVGFLKTPNAR